MMRWVVTGPAGGGKSTLCDLLAARGAVVIDGDGLGHEILARPDIVTRIATEFGSGVVTDGSVDRSILGPLVFGDPAALDRLNRITLAPLGQLAAERLDDLAAGGRYRLAVLEAAVYFLLPPVPGVDLVVTVTAAPAIRIARMTRKGHLTGDQARARVAAQLSLEEAWGTADIVLENDGNLAGLEVAADRLWSRVID